MNCTDYQEAASGRCLRHQRGYYYFMPTPLPPKIDYDMDLANLMAEANRALSELSGTGRNLKNPYLLVSPYIMREAVSSSKIEGTQSSMSDLFIYEASAHKESRFSDTREVFNYVSTMAEGVKLLKELPISTRFICELHGTLLKGVRGEHGTPGELRQSQNWIGPPGCLLNEATYVPPPLEELGNVLGEWEKYVNSAPNEQTVMQAAIMHYQFEAIHPFIDGNGRIGRLLVTLFLMQKGLLSHPLLYLSEFFEKHRQDYYRLLLEVSQKGAWEEWCKFFFRGVIQMSEDALENSISLMELHEIFCKMLYDAKRVPEITHRMVDEIFISPVISISNLSRKWEVAYTSIKAGVVALEKLGILKEITGRSRGRMYASAEVMLFLTGETI